MKTIFKSKSNIKKFIVSVSLVLVLLMSGGFGGKDFEIAKHFDIFATLYRELYINYIEEINTSELFQAGINEMLNTLDPYTNFISESEIEDYRLMTTGQYGGIGALVGMRDSKIVITEPYEGFPAHEAGLKAGDVILEINNQSAMSRTSEEIANILKGQPGTTVEMLISRENEPEPFRVSIKREVIRIDNIPYYGVLENKTGYIKLTNFTQNAGREVREAFNDLRENHGIERIILDIRDNGGGLLNEAVNITNLFIERNNKIVSTRGRLEERNTTHHTLNHPVDPEIPLVILVNRQSASASEIVAGALQDYDRGVIMGERTFGKGLVQNIIPLSYNTQLKVTVAEYLIPSGRSIQAIDYAVRHDDGSVSRIPDSLKTPFETKDGRVVYDGGGIEPDVKIEPPVLSNISKALLTEFLIFNFATKFHRNNPEIANAKDFEITSAIYNDFLDFISDKDYEYENESEKKLRELKEALKKDEYYEYFKGHVSEFQTLISDKKSQDLEIFRDEIERLLLLEIVPRYYYQRGRVEASLSEDRIIAKAIEVLYDEEKYDNILSAADTEDLHRN